MAIVTATEKARFLNLPLITASCAVATTTDTIYFENSPGVLIKSGWLHNGTDATTSIYGWKFNSVACDATIAAGTTAITYDGATANTRGHNNYYIKCTATGEIMYVVHDSGYDSTSGTFTVIRGALGTDQGALADNDDLEILNSVIITYPAPNVNTSVVHLLYHELPSDPYAQVWGT
jgi:hypothetical protein